MTNEVSPVNATMVKQLLEQRPDYVSRFFIGVSKDGMVRMTFADENSNLGDDNPPIHMVHSVVMTMQSFINMMQMLAQLHNKIVTKPQVFGESPVTQEPPAVEKERLN